MPGHGKSCWTNEQLLSYYGEVCRSHEEITDFRAKLLALLPIASGTGIGLLVIHADGKGDIPAWLLVPLGLFGALVTVGLFFFEFRQMDQCRQLRNTGVWIEDRLEFDAGRFRSERAKLGLREIWPPNYKERENKLRKPERAETEASDEYNVSDKSGLGVVNVRNAGCIVYGTVFVSWIAVLAWGIKEAFH
jgi:hypothetical protein